MPITFRKFTASVKLSEETTAYHAQVLFEGKVIGESRNEGRGGMGHFRANPDADLALVERANHWAMAQPILEDDGTQMEIDGRPMFFEGIGDYCDHLADHTLSQKQLVSQVKRLLKTHIVFLNPDAGPGVFQIKQTWRPELEASLKKRFPQARILNAMPVDQAIEAFGSAQEQELAAQARKSRARTPGP